jgi:predicted phosphodiesterase
MTYNEEQEQKFQEELLGLVYPYERRTPDWSESDPEKILVLADPHEPYGNEVVYAEALKHRDSKCIVLVGDLGDYYSKSRFRKNRDTKFRDEVRAVFHRMEWLSHYWPEVKIMMGNHDNRPEKQLQDSLPTDLLILTEQNLIKRLASYFPNVEIVGQQLDGSDIALSHIYQLEGTDIVFTHAEISRKQNTATLEYVSNYLHQWGHLINLKPWRVIAQAHNHQDAKLSKGREKWFQLPAACDPFSHGMEYIFGPRLIGSPPSIGLSVFFVSNGSCDYNRSHHIVLDYNA